MPEISLYSPDILMGVRRDAFFACMRMPRKKRRYLAAREESDLSLILHPTAEVLSQKRAEWVFGRLYVRHSSASQLRTRSDSLISFMVRVPALKSYFTFYGLSSCQMIGPILFRPDV